MKKKTLILAVSALIATIMISCNCKEQAIQDENGTPAAINTIMQRKSVRSYTADTISSDVMEHLLRAAVAAPSGMDIRPWHIVVMTDKSQYDSLFVGNFNMEKYKQAAAVIIFCADTTVTRAPRENPDAPAVTMPNPMWRDDLGACTENFLLAVEAYGLGAVWTACYPFHDRMDPVTAYLNLPSNVLPYAIVPVGYPAGDEAPKDKWDPSRIHTNCW